MRGFGECVARALWRVGALALAVAVSVGAAHAQSPNNPPAAKPEVMENCPGLVADNRLPLKPVAFRRVALDADQVRITFVGHATFLIESPQLVRIATDYNDYVRPPVLPDIATMNHAHSTHYTLSPDPGIKYVLHGWADDQIPPRVDLQYKDVRVRNVPTNIRSF